MPVGAIKVAVPRCLVSVEFAKKSGAGMGLQMEWLLVMMLCAALGTPVAARRIVLRPLSASELREALEEMQAQDSPNGRSVSSALAGLKGFALGVTNGIGGALLYDVATSAQGSEYLSNLYSSVSDYIGNAGGGGGSSSSGGTTQELCFDSRSVDGDQLLQQARRSGALFEQEEEEEEEQQQLEEDEYEYDDEDVPLAQPAQLRQVDLDGIRQSMTCLVINRGRALVRHRRSLPAERV